MRIFEPLTEKVVRWEAWDGSAGGLEHLHVRRRGDGIVASSVVIGSVSGTPFGLRYRLLIDSAWHVRQADLETTSGTSLHLESDGAGNWIENGRPNPALAGCFDIDIEATPFTNTLPIRRLALKAAQGMPVRLVYVSVPSLAVTIGNQHYIAVEIGKMYRFESRDHAFTADLPVDQHGIVENYPALFRRTL